MKIFLDFDRVLHDTSRMIANTNQYLRKLGIEPDRWRASWSEMYKPSHHRTGLYSIENHFQRYGDKHKRDVAGFAEGYYEFQKAFDYLFSETIPFIKAVKKISQPVLITHGTPKWQMWKIRKSGVHKFFKQIIVVPSFKALRIGKYLSRAELNVFVDDNQTEIEEMRKRYPEVVAIHLVRNGRFDFADKAANADFHVANLRQVLVILKLLNDTFTKDVSKAVSALKKGKAVVYPTDTAYGLAVDATNPKAVRELYKIKNQNTKKPVHIVVGDLKMAKKYAQFDEIAEKLFKKYLPGALTLVLPLKDMKLSGLSGNTGTIGVRMPDNKIALKLVKKFGRPITTTSANPHGGITPYSAVDSFKQFFTKNHQPDLYLDAGALPQTLPSTIIKIEKNKITTLRKGPIRAAA